MTTCTAAKAFRRIDDHNDVLVLTCDLEQGHAPLETHHDKDHDAKWSSR